MDKLESTLDLYLVKKAPFTLPKNVKDALVSFSPWLALIGGVFGLMAALAILGIGTAFAPMALFGGASVAGSYFSTFAISSILLGVTGIMDLMAIGPLKARKMKGWKLLYYAELIWIVSYIVRLDLWNVIIGGVIGLYFLFQIKEYYK